MNLYPAQEAERHCIAGDRLPGQSVVRGSGAPTLHTVHDGKVAGEGLARRGWAGCWVD